MSKLLEEFKKRAKFISSLRYDDAETRLLGLYKWMIDQTPIKHIIDTLKSSIDVEALLATATEHTPPEASTPEEIAVVGIRIIEDCADEPLYQLAYKYGVHPPYSTNNIQPTIDEFVERFIVPAIEYIGDELESSEQLEIPVDHLHAKLKEVFEYPFHSQFPETASIFQSVSDTLNSDDPEFMWFNVANSCREALKKFAIELTIIHEVVLEPNTKSGDVKSILRSYVLQRYSQGRYRDTLLSLVQSIWDHAQSILHRETTNKEEATRCFIWTYLLVLELANLILQEHS
jgi:hypothetical protein